MSDVAHVAGGQLRSFVERIERIEVEIGELNDGKKDVYAEAKGSGFDTKVLKRVIAARRQDQDAREEADAIFDLYWGALQGDFVQAHARVEIVDEIPSGMASETEDPSPVVAVVIRDGAANGGGGHVTEPAGETIEQAGAALRGDPPAPAAPDVELVAAKRGCQKPGACRVSSPIALCHTCNDAFMRLPVEERRAMLARQTAAPAARVAEMA